MYNTPKRSHCADNDAAIASQKSPAFANLRHVRSNAFHHRPDILIHIGIDMLAKQDMPAAYLPRMEGLRLS